MEREIKFRAWNGNNMVDLYKTTTFAIKDDLKIDGLFIPFSTKYNLMQYVGLKDKNGKEIYEGDICDCWILDNPDEIKFYNTVICYYGSFGYIDKDNQFHSFAEHQDISKPQINDWEIIGNIYENPELLK